MQYHSPAAFFFLEVPQQTPIFSAFTSYKPYVDQFS